MARPKLLMLDERRTILSDSAEELIRDERGGGRRICGRSEREDGDRRAK